MTNEVQAHGAQTQKKPLVNRRVGFNVHVGYLVDLDIVQGLYERGWKIAHNTATQFEFRKQDKNGAWTVDQDSAEFEQDFRALGGGAPRG
jgi:hypothetical protein